RAVICALHGRRQTQCSGSDGQECFLAAALPPLRPAALCWAVVPPWLDLPLPLWDFSPPCLDALDELAIRAARCLDMPLSLRASYCFSFFTLADFDGMTMLPLLAMSVVAEGSGELGAAHLGATRQVAALGFFVELLAGLG